MTMSISWKPSVSDSRGVNNGRFYIYVQILSKCLGPMPDTSDCQNKVWQHFCSIVPLCPHALLSCTSADSGTINILKDFSTVFAVNLLFGLT